MLYLIEEERVRQSKTAFRRLAKKCTVDILADADAKGKQTLADVIQEVAMKVGPLCDPPRAAALDKDALFLSVVEETFHNHVVREQNRSRAAMEQMQSQSSSQLEASCDHGLYSLFVHCQMFATKHPCSLLLVERKSTLYLH
jgi:hypothetical protein